MNVDAFDNGRGQMPRERILHLTRSDFVRQTFKVGGHGGQHRDKTDAGVRFIHEPSGARGQATESRSQVENERAAFRRLANSIKFRLWVSEFHAALDRGTVEEEVERQMQPEMLKIEFRDEDGKWVTE